MNRYLLYRVVGSLLFLEAFFMTWCLAVSLWYGESDMLAFVTGVVITASVGALLRWEGREAKGGMTRKDAYLIVTVLWLVFSLFGSIPFIVGGYLPSITDAFFETMSGFTTTGATVINDVDSMPHGILFWRSLTQWVGGLGIVFFTIAVLPSMVGGSVRIFAAEATGPIRTKLHPRLSTTAKRIWSIYLLLTAACAVTFCIAGMNIFDGINHAMTTTATGGFATHNDSIEFYNSPALEYAGALFQFLSGINFTLLYLTFFKGKFKGMFSNSELKFYLLLVCSFTAVITVMLIVNNHYNIEHAFRSSLFQVVSFITTTGLFSDDVAQWHHLSWVFLAILMFIGACAGSTSGGFKSIRALMVWKIIRNSFHQILHPKAVLPVKINQHTITTTQTNTLMAFFAVFVLACLFTSTLMIAMGIDNTNAITISLSCISNVGPTLGTQIGPEMSWATLPDIVKWMCSLLMLIGRLEIFSVLLLFSRSFWKDN